MNTIVPSTCFPFSQAHSFYWCQFSLRFPLIPLFCITIWKFLEFYKQENLSLFHFRFIVWLFEKYWKSTHLKFQNNTAREPLSLFVNDLVFFIKNVVFPFLLLKIKRIQSPISKRNHAVRHESCRLLFFYGCVELLSSAVRGMFCYHSWRLILSIIW